MTTISEHPIIQLEETSETSRTLFFDPTVINAEVELYRQLAGDLYTESAGEITVHLENLPYGRLLVCRNPVYNGQYTLDHAVEALCGYLRENCASCADFDHQD